MTQVLPDIQLEELLQEVPRCEAFLDEEMTKQCPNPAAWRLIIDSQECTCKVKQDMCLSCTRCKDAELAMQDRARYECRVCDAPVTIRFEPL